MANTDPVEFVLLDTDFTTKLAILPAKGGNFYVELNEPGSGKLEIPKDSNAHSLVTEGMFVQVNYRGSPRGGFFVDNIKPVDADSNEGEGQQVELSGRGMLAILEDAVVWNDNTGNTSRQFTGTQAGILIQLIDEAAARGGLTNVTYDFSDTVDSESNSWTDNEDISIPVNTTYLDILRQFVKNGIDFDMILETNGTFTLQAFKNGLGSDVSSTIAFRVGENITKAAEMNLGTKIKNVFQVKYRDGFVVVSDPTSISNYRRRETGLNIENAQSASSATTYASAQLANEKDPQVSIPISVYDGVGASVFLDYSKGDTVRIDRFGVSESQRIKGLQLAFDETGFAHIDITLNSTFVELDIDMRRDLDWLMNQWNTARDADLLETSYWAAIGDPNVTYANTGMIQVGSKLYMVSSNYLLIYDILNGGWSRIDLSGYGARVLVHIGGIIYIGGFHKVQTYEIATGTVTDIADVTSSGNPALEQVSSMVAIGTNIYMAGLYDAIGTLSTANVVEYDTLTDTWTDLGEVSGNVTATLMTDGTNLFLGNVNTVRKWDTSSWSTVGTYPSGASSILTMAMYGDNILAGGAVTNGMYEWNGLTWEIFGGGLNGSVVDIKVYLTDVYATGYFTDRGSYIAKYSGGAWWELESGLDDNGTDLLLYESDSGVTVYVAGTFTTAGGKDAQGIAAYFTAFSALADYLETAGSNSFDMAAAIHNAIAKTALVAADEVGFWDSVSTRLRKITWANVLLTIKAYTDTLYVALTGDQTVAGVKTFSSDPIIPDEAYDATDWNGSLEPPTKNAVRDKIESMGGGGTPAGSDTEIQYNNAGAFGANSKFVRDSNNGIIIGETPTPTTVANGLYQSGDISTPHFIESFGTGVASFLSFIRGRGTKASPTAVQADDVLGRVRGRGFDGAGSIGDTSAEIRMLASENHSGSAHGTKFDILVTPNGSTTLTSALTIAQNGVATFVADPIIPDEAYGSGWNGVLEPPTKNAVYDKIETVVSGWLEVTETWTLRTQAYTNDPAAGNNIVLNMTNTLGFYIGQQVNVSSSAGNENAIVTAVVANTSITVNTLALNHTTTTPLVIALNGFTLSGDYSTDKNYAKDVKVRYKDGGSNEYGVIGRNVHSSGTTYINLIANTDYTFSSSSITETYVSFIQDPEGFPHWFNYAVHYSAGGSMTFTTVTTELAQWNAMGLGLFFEHRANGTTGGSGDPSIYATLPIPPAEAVNGLFVVTVADTVGDVGRGVINVASTTPRVQYSKIANANWGIGASRIVIGEGFYRY